MATDGITSGLAVVGLCLIALAAMWPFLAVVVYPLWLTLLRRPTPSAGEETDRELPTVTAIVAARNGEAVVERKVRELLAMDYPPEKVNVIVASDGSTDRTAEIVRGINDPRATVLEFKEHVGKTTAVNNAVATATGEVLAFSDVSTRWRPDSLKKMVLRCTEEGVGCACGRIVYSGGNSDIADGFSIYQRFEIRLRDLVGGARLLTSVSGAMHVVRKRHWRPMPEALTADLVLPQLVHVDGAGVVYVADAIGEETPRDSVKQEFRARVRIATRSVQSAAWTVPQLLRAGRLAPVFVLLCHKVLRWSIWVPAALFFAGCALLAPRSLLFAVALAGQTLIYLAGVLQLKMGVRILPGKLQAIAGYWTLAVAALAKGTLSGLSGSTAATRWNPED